MVSVLLMGNSHLDHCYQNAKSNDSLNFGFNDLKIIWEKGIEPVKLLEKTYKETVSKHGQLDVVYILSGGYEIILNKDSKSLVVKIKELVHFLQSSNVKYIVICSILEQKSSVGKERINKEIQTANKELAKTFKNVENVFFINIRPPGNIKDLLDDDHYHLKEELYDHVNKRLIKSFTERILPNLPNITASDKPEENHVKDMTKQAQSLKSSMKRQDPSLDQRLGDFKQTLLNDYNHYFIKEQELKKELSTIQEKLEKVTHDKNEVENIFKRLFNQDLVNMMNLE